VSILVTRIRQNGGLWPKSGNPPLFQSFDLSLNKKGWHKYTIGQEESPDVGDIWVYGKPGVMKHVGVILNSVGNQWITVEAGGGIIGQYQSIKRAGWHAPDYTQLYGWINIDEYFDTWQNSNYS
jgi:hypothetical protein